MHLFYLGFEIWIRVTLKLDPELGTSVGKLCLRVLFDLRNIRSLVGKDRSLIGTDSHRNAIGCE